MTPYASILNDLVFGTSTNRYSGVACKKVRYQLFPSDISCHSCSLQISAVTAVPFRYQLSQLFSSDISCHSCSLQISAVPTVPFIYQLSQLICGHNCLSLPAVAVYQLRFPKLGVCLCKFSFVIQVYFIWICPSHRSFEWFIDAIR